MTFQVHHVNIYIIVYRAVFGADKTARSDTHKGWYTVKDYKQFLLDTKNNEKLSNDINREMEKLAEMYPDKTDRELLTIAAKAHGYGFNVLDILNTKIILRSTR